MEEHKHPSFYKSYSNTVYVRRASDNHYVGLMGAFLMYKVFACQLVNLHKIMNIRQRFELIFTHQDCGHTLLH
jgi:hypothetical protein